MTAPQAPRPVRRPRKAPQDESTEVYFDLPRYRWRFMFADGQTLDVISRCSDSRLNDFAFTHHYGKPAKDDPAKIVGQTRLEEIPDRETTPGEYVYRPHT
jgi:hypothetical protein